MDKKVLYMIMINWVCLYNLCTVIQIKPNNLGFSRRDMQFVRNFIKCFRPSDDDRQRLETVLENGTRNREDSIYGEECSKYFEMALYQKLDNMIKNGEKVDIRCYTHSNIKIRNDENGNSLPRLADFAEMFIDTDDYSIELRLNYKYTNREMKDYIKVKVKKERDRSEDDVVIKAIYKLGNELSGMNNLGEKKLFNTTKALELKDVYRNVKNQRAGSFDPEDGMVHVDLRGIYTKEEKIAFLKEVYNKYKHNNPMYKIKLDNGAGLIAVTIINDKRVIVSVDRNVWQLLYEPS